MATKKLNDVSSWKADIIRSSMVRFEEHVLEPARAALDSRRAELELQLATASTSADSELRMRMIEADIASLEATRKQAEEYSEAVKAQFLARFDDALTAA
jgi:hypothetical protein